MVTPIEQRYIDQHPGSAERYSIAKDLFPDGVTHDARRLKPFPIYVTHAAGPYKWDVDGHRMIDYRTGHGSMILGHSHPDIVSAVTEQMSKGTHLSASTDSEILWGQLVRELIPSAEKVRFHSSGTEATMMGIRMARAYTGKSKVIKFDDHFHGWCDYLVAGSDGIGGIPRETLDTMIVLPPNDIAIVEKAIQDSGDVAALILEPTGAHMGQYPIRPTFLNELRKVTERYGVVLVFDEVVTGFRTSKGGAQGYYGVIPDMTTMAKILGGGLPGGAVAGKAEIINMIETRDDPVWNRERRIAHNGTFNANPLSAAAGTTALNLIMTTPVNDTTDARGKYLKERLNDLLARLEIPGCASGLDSMVFLRLGVNAESADAEKNPNVVEDIHKAADSIREHQLSLALLNHGVDSGTRFIIGMTHSEQDVDDTVTAVEKALVEIREDGLI